jgi:hypothetical protein
LRVSDELFNWIVGSPFDEQKKSGSLRHP